MSIVIALWPIFVASLAKFFNGKQNSQKAWTGGPISWPKSFWLSYTVLTWFFLPIVFLLHPDFNQALRSLFYFHLASWWIRGSLELIMIYKWFNWSPRYGISHDILHISVVATILCLNWQQAFAQASSSSMALLSLIFSLMILFTTLAEILFAVLFLRFRTAQEAKENIYFASSDPKWILINRVTLTVVIIAMTHLVGQSFFLILK